jgi:hypothetical protein
LRAGAAPLSPNPSSLDLKIGALESQMNSKFDTFGKDINHIVVELKAEMGKHEIRLVWRMFFAVSVLISLSYLLIVYRR